jgi:hypothetical protein
MLLTLNQGGTNRHPVGTASGLRVMGLFVNRYASRWLVSTWPFHCMNGSGYDR